MKNLSENKRIKATTGQMMAVTRFYLGDRIGLVSLAKQRLINGVSKNTVSPHIVSPGFEVTQPSVFRDIDYECWYTN